MTQRRWLGLIGILAIASLAGCARCPKRQQQGHGGHVQVAQPVATPGLNPVQPLPNVVDASELTGFAKIELELKARRETLGSYEYVALSPQGCQCLAATASDMGRMIAQERETVKLQEQDSKNSQQGSILCPCQEPEDTSGNRELDETILGYEELEARNQSAASALELYFRLAEAEANRKWLRESFDEFDRVIAEVKRVKQSGLELPFDVAELERQRLDSLDRQAALDLLVQQLGTGLERLIGYRDHDPARRIWPTVELRARNELPEMESAVLVGLSQRPELNMLRDLRGQMTSENLPQIRQLLQRVNPLLGASPTATVIPPLFARMAARRSSNNNEAELSARRQQLEAYREEREHAISMEIRLAVIRMQASREQIVLAQERVSQWRAEVDRTQLEARVQQATFLDVSAARLKRYAAESDLVHRIVDAEIALVELRKAQGVLVYDCGFLPPITPHTCQESQRIHMAHATRNRRPVPAPAPIEALPPVEQDAPPAPNEVSVPRRPVLRQVEHPVAPLPLDPL